MAFLKDSGSKKIVDAIRYTAKQNVWNDPEEEVLPEDICTIIGPPGPQGERGPQGEGFSIYKSYVSIEEMNNDANNVEVGKFVIIAAVGPHPEEDPDNSKLFVRDSEGGFTFVNDLSGSQGIQGPTEWEKITDRPTSLPASDVYDWAKASSKPSYAWSEITSKPSTFTPSDHTHNYAGSSSAGGSANSLSYFKNTSTTDVGIDDTSANAVGYVSGTNSILGQNDGAMYKQVYSGSLAHEIYGDYKTGQIAVRGKNNGTWQAWRTILDSSNYDNYVKSSPIFKTKSYTITVGVLSAGDAKWDQTYYIDILKGYTPAVISGFYLTGTNYTKCTITKIALSGSNSLLWSVQNLDSASTGELTLTVNVLYIRTTNIS